MKIQQPRIWIHQNYDVIKHWLFVIIGFTLIAFALLSYANSNRLLKQVNVLAEQNKVLSQQNKKLNQETGLTGDATQKVVLQNRDNLNCLAKVFAEYTHNFLPITIDDLQNCVVKVGTSGSSALKTSNSGAVHTSPSKAPTPQSSSAPVSDTPQESSNSSPNPTTSASKPQPNLLHRILDDIDPLN